MEQEVEMLIDLLDEYEEGELTTREFYSGLKEKSQGALAKCILCLHNRSNDCDKENERNIELCDALRRKNEKMKCSIARLKFGIAYWKSRVLNPCNSCDVMLIKNIELNSSLACLQSENDMLKSNASMPCNSCVALHNDLDLARNKIVVLKSSASLPCVFCESLLAEINKLNLTHSTAVDELEHDRAKICEMKSMPCSMCSFIVDDNICSTSCDIHDTLSDVNDNDCSCDFICTSCINLENEVLALKQMRDEMSAKLAEHNDMSARFEIEVDLLHTTYAKCIEEQMESLRNALCGTCDRLKF